MCKTFTLVSIFSLSWYLVLCKCQIFNVEKPYIASGNALFYTPVTFGMTSATMFYYTQIIQGFFYNQTQNVAQVTDFWDVSKKLLIFTIPRLILDPYIDVPPCKVRERDSA